MAWTLSTDVSAYDAAAGDFLRSDCERNTISVTVVDNAKRRGELRDPPELYAWWTAENGEVTGCASITSPWPVLIDQAPEDSLRPLAETLLDAGADVVGVNSPSQTAAIFASMWCSLTGNRAVLQTAMRLFRLDELSAVPAQPAGSARMATDDDRPLLIEWFNAFGEQVHGPMPSAEEQVRERLDADAMWIWVDASGVPVSMVGHTVPVEGVARVGPVYTPSEHRRRGYAEALTHHVSSQLVDRGLGAVLHTELANPTSNAIYVRVGYRPVFDRIALDFEPGEPTTKG